MAYVVAYDIGTTGVKTCLFRLGKDIALIASAQQGYGLYILSNGGAEQDADEWWDAMCATTRNLFEQTDIHPSDIAGISFCSQMQGLVLADKEGNAVRRPMSYMDQRARREVRDGMAHGLQIGGANIIHLIKSLTIMRAVSSSVKDPVWKYKWIEKNEPENFKKTYKWLDVKEYLICRCTGEFVMTEDSAYSTFLYDTRKGREGWSKTLCRMCGVRMEHLPKIIKTTDIAGKITAHAAAGLGLAEGTPVFGGGGDATLIGVGAGCTSLGDTHIYSGTSGWVSTVVEKQTVDIDAMIGSIVGAQHGRYNYFAEMETAGKCLEWVKNHLALDEIGIYLTKKHITESQEAVYTSLYDYMTQTVKDVPPGAGGVIFTPWLHGNRCPFEDPNAAGMFFNIRLETGKTELIRAVLEGVCYHLRWMLECQDKKIKTSDPIRFVGGGALSDVTCRILADITGRTIETVASPQNVGAVGAAAIMGVGLGIIQNLDGVKDFIPAIRTFEPDLSRKPAYDKNFAVFKKLYKTNKDSFKALNASIKSDQNFDRRQSYGDPLQIRK
jgi:xylulokinase